LIACDFYGRSNLSKKKLRFGKTKLIINRRCTQIYADYTNLCLFVVLASRL
jgi:hypothetical protein